MGFAERFMTIFNRLVTAEMLARQFVTFNLIINFIGNDKIKNEY